MESLGFSDTFIKKVLADNQVMLPPEDLEFVILQLFKDSHRLDILKHKLILELFCPVQVEALGGQKVPKPPKVDLEDDFDDNLLDEY